MKPGKEVMYAYKKHLLSVIQMDTMFQVETKYGMQYGFKGDYLCTNYNGDQFIKAKDLFEENFIPVVKVDDSIITSEEKESLKNEYIRQLSDAVDENGKWKYL